MTYEELKKAYEEMSEKCSELEKKIEDKNLEIENLTEQLLKRNQMLFGKKAERSKNLYIERARGLNPLHTFPAALYRNYIQQFYGL